MPIAHPLKIMAVTYHNEKKIMTRCLSCPYQLGPSKQFPNSAVSVPLPWWYLHRTGGIDYTGRRVRRHCLYTLQKEVLTTLRVKSWVSIAISVRQPGCCTYQKTPPGILMVVGDHSRFNLSRCAFRCISEAGNLQDTKPGIPVMRPPIL